MSLYATYHGFVRNFYYSGITVTGTEHIPPEGPVLALCLHRNGIVDAFVYAAAIHRVRFLVRAKLRRGLVGKLLFPGLDVNRSGDGGAREEILEAIGSSVDRLKSGEAMGIFPEGTSQLGPRHLPFRSGAAWIARDSLERGVPLVVLPLGIHYEFPWAFRSRVEVVVGQPIPLGSPGQGEAGSAGLREIRQRFTTALEEVGINVPDRDFQDLLQKFACLASLGTGHRYFKALKVMERQLPPAALSAWRSLEAGMKGKWVGKYQGVPLFPNRTPWIPPLLVVFLAIPVLSGLLLNLLPLLVGWLGGRLLADDTNVIALWRLLTGLPLAILWALAWMILAATLGNVWIAVTYLSLTGIALGGWDRLKRLAVISWNGLFHHRLRAGAMEVRQLILLEPAFRNEAVETCRNAGTNHRKRE